MARNKLIVRANYNCRRVKYHRRKVRSAIKYIGGRMRNRDIKVKQIIFQSQNNEV